MKEDKNADVSVKYNGKTIYLNKLLIERQGVDAKTVDELRSKHYRRLQLLEKMENTDDPVSLKTLNKSIIEIDFKLQELWGFPQDPNYHRWWEVPKCVCPHLDNIDNYGTKYRITRGDCPIHGNSLK